MLSLKVRHCVRTIFAFNPVSLKYFILKRIGYQLDPILQSRLRLVLFILFIHNIITHYTRLLLRITYTRYNISQSYFSYNRQCRLQYLYYTYHLNSLQGYNPKHKNHFQDNNSDQNNCRGTTSRIDFPNDFFDNLHKSRIYIII